MHCQSSIKHGKHSVRQAILEENIQSAETGRERISGVFLQKNARVSRHPTINRTEKRPRKWTCHWFPVQHTTERVLGVKRKASLQWRRAQNVAHSCSGCIRYRHSRHVCNWIPSYASWCFSEGQLLSSHERHVLRGITEASIDSVCHGRKRPSRKTSQTYEDCRCCVGKNDERAT